jgi:hypothetical protein
LQEPHQIRNNSLAVVDPSAVMPLSVTLPSTIVSILTIGGATTILLCSCGAPMNSAPYIDFEIQLRRCWSPDQQPSKIYSKQSLLGAANNEESPQTSSASGGDSAAWKIVARINMNHR